MQLSVIAVGTTRGRLASWGALWAKDHQPPQEQHCQPNAPMTYAAKYIGELLQPLIRCE